VRVLAIETATPLASCAVVDGSGVLAEQTLRAPMRHLEWLLPAVDDMLRSLALRPHEIQGIAVSRGPGGFTGLRIGIATAAAWARSARIPLLGVETLEALAMVAGGTGWVFAVLDAHRGEVAAGLYRGGPDGLLVRAAGPILAAPEVASREAAAALDGAAAGPGDPVLVVGDGLERHRDALLAGLGGRGVVGGGHLHPRAAAVGMLGRARLLAGAQDDPHVLAPLYGRRPAVRTWQETPGGSGNPNRPWC